MRAGKREASTLSSSSSQNITTETPKIANEIALEHLETGAPEESALPLQAGADVEPTAPTFAELGVLPEIVSALNAVGIERTFAIQALTLPLALAGEDLIGQARTGMGKTLGFGVPLIQRITNTDGTPQALVVVPTRELCIQVANDLTAAGKNLGIRTLAVYGGRPYETQIEALRKGVDLVIGTPGRLLDLAEQRHLVLGKIRGLVLDEADEMLDLGFLPDIERILSMVPEKRQTMLFSATMPGPIITLARTFLTQPTHIRAEENNQSAVHERVTQFVYRAHSMDKLNLVAKSLQAEGRGLTMIFARTKRTAQKVADDLIERGFATAAVHGDLGQGAREQALRAFRSGKVDVLVATDVAARGIDVDDVTHVINYQTPEDEKAFVHRIGRTARAGKKGVAITLVDWDEEPRWKAISDTLGLGKPEPVETYSTSKHLFSDLGIPEGATGRLPLGKRTRAGLSAEPEENLGGRQRSRSANTSPSTARRSRRRTRGGASAAAGETGENTQSEQGATTEAGDKPRRRVRQRTRAKSVSEGSSASEAAPKETAVGTESETSVKRPTRRRRRVGSTDSASGPDSPSSAT